MSDWQPIETAPKILVYFDIGLKTYIDTVQLCEGQLIFHIFYN